MSEQMGYDPYATLRKIQFEVMAVMSATILPLMLSIAEARINPIPYHTSIMTGRMWLAELLNGHPERMRTELGVHKHVFLALVEEIRILGLVNDERCSIKLDEQLAIFLYTCVTGLSIRHVGERFQHANGSIARAFRNMATIFSSNPFYSRWVQFPEPQDQPAQFLHPRKLWPFFHNALGAIDGSHISFAPSASERLAYRNRKGFLSQNCLFICSFALFFTFALTGWEGSATDARIWADAAHELAIPEGWYLLADAGFPHCKELLVPYRGVRYHLAEWGRAKLRPQNRKELFNLHHAQARNVIERIFGVLKRRFKILLLAPEYDANLQAKIPAALCAIHNFIRQHDVEEGALPTSATAAGGYAGNDQYTHLVELDEGVHTDEEGSEPEATQRRDAIAEKMWQQYQQELASRGLLDNDLSDSDDDEQAPDVV